MHSLAHRNSDGACGSVSVQAKPGEMTRRNLVGSHKEPWLRFTYNEPWVASTAAGLRLDPLFSTVLNISALQRLSSSSPNAICQKATCRKRHFTSRCLRRASRSSPRPSSRREMTTATKPRRATASTTVAMRPTTDDIPITTPDCNGYAIQISETGNLEADEV